MTDFRKAFPDLNFWGTADLIAEGDYVVGRWEGGWHPHRPCIPRLFGGITASQHWARDEVHRNDRSKA